MGKVNGKKNSEDKDLTYLESDAQCMAYIFAKCPRRVRLVRICILLSGSTFDVACTKLVSAAAFLASCKKKKFTFNP